MQPVKHSGQTGFDQLVNVEITREESGSVHGALLKAYSLPESTGHDFRLSSDCSTLYVSTTHHVYEFPIALETFRPFEPLANIMDVKSFSIDSKSGQMIYTVADKGGYWTSTLRFALPQNTVPLPTPIYKTRWVTDLPPTCTEIAFRDTETPYQITTMTSSFKTDII